VLESVDPAPHVQQRHLVLGARELESKSAAEMVAAAKGEPPFGFLKIPLTLSSPGAASPEAAAFHHV
jgi:hypothetical protein